MKYRKFTKYELKEIRKQKLERAFQGTGKYLYQNNTPGTLNLPSKPATAPVSLGKNQTFIGDSYYHQFVRTNELKILETLEDPNKKETEPMPEKLILDQPDTITEQGKVEHVVKNDSPVQPLRESEKQEEPKEVLLNEHPVDDGFMIVE